MKLFTKPRITEWWLLRPGDQIALGVRGKVIESVGAYVDADLIDRVTWAAVHDVTGPVHKVLIIHSLGESGPGRSTKCCIMREAIEFDPWSYVKAV